MEQGVLVIGQRRGHNHLRVQELRRGMTGTGHDATSFHSWTLAERANHTIIKRLDPILLLLADLGLRLDDIPELQYILESFQY
jgi:hypothetical protein